MAARAAHLYPPLETVRGGTSLRTETSDGAELDIHVAGDGPTVVLCHCWTGTKDTWAPVAASLVRRGHRVVRYDQRGHGASTFGRDGFTVERFGRDLSEVLEAVDASGAVVAGHSLGGMTALAFAAHHPDRVERHVRSLVLVSTTAAGLARTPLGRVGRRLVAAPSVERMMRSKRGTALVRGALGRQANPNAVLATRDSFVATPPEVRLGVVEAMLAMDLGRVCGRIALPATVAVGTRDTLTPPAHARRLAASLPGARLVMVEGAGHMLPLERTDLVAGLIEDAAR